MIEYNCFLQYFLLSHFASMLSGSNGSTLIFFSLFCDSSLAMTAKQTSYIDVVNSLMKLHSNSDQNTHLCYAIHTSNLVTNLVYLLAQNFASFPLINASLSIRLDHNNFLIWLENMKNLIIVYGFEGFIEVTMIAQPKFLDFSCNIVNSRYTN